MRVADDLDLGDLNGLGVSTLTKLVRSVAKTVVRVATKVDTTVKRVTGKVVKTFKLIVKQPQRLLYIIPGYGAIGYVLKRNKKLRNQVFTNFSKAAPFLQAACTVLNLILPGFGTAMALGIAAANMAIQITRLRESQKAMRREEEVVTAENAAIMAEADTATMNAYNIGAAYILETYDVSREEFQLLTIEERSKFLNLIVYDRHQKEITENLGVTRDQFVAMTVEQEGEVLALTGTAVPGAPALPPEAQAILGPETTTAVVQPGSGPMLAPLAAEGMSPWVTYSLIGGGVATVGILVYLVAASRKQHVG